MFNTERARQGDTKSEGHIKANYSSLILVRIIFMTLERGNDKEKITIRYSALSAKQPE